MQRLLYLIIISSLVFSCGRPGSSVRTEGYAGHATGFKVERSAGYTLVELTDPWNAGRILQRYVLVPRSASLPDDLPQGTLVRTPIRRLAVYSSVHVAMIEMLGALESIEGVCEPMYIGSEAVRERVASGITADLGMSVSPNVERMIDREIEYIIASPFRNADYGAAAKTGIPIIEGADYTETTPLGRAEWIRFFGLLLEREEKADSLFAATEGEYRALKQLAASAPGRPGVLTEKRYGSSWYVPVGGSYMSVMLSDAGAANAFDHLSGVGSVPLAFETVLDTAVDADFWLIKYNTAALLTYKSLRDEFTPYANFEAYRNRNIYACHTGLTPYHEDTPIRPDLLLKDLIRIFHPHLLPNHSPRYYQPIAEE
ncbi:MAG: ABC transporter substrate-binding protein [Tannerellaceae bacterium]|jgi:iron complex transport system substrate-binding protein|nr:ABC transporter substrate-binding protein [Tannerellaceae bacterium]